MLAVSMPRCHLIRVGLAAIFLLLLIAIFVSYQNDGLIKLRPDSLAKASLTMKELDDLSTTNTTCPVCFGRDACNELMLDVSRGVLKVSREPQTPKDLGQTIHSVYRNGKVRFWMKTQASSPSLMHGFEQVICRKGTQSFFNSYIY
jgi:hypothetical protein